MNHDQLVFILISPFSEPQSVGIDPDHICLSLSIYKIMVMLTMMMILKMLLAMIIVRMMAPGADNDDYSEDGGARC